MGIYRMYPGDDGETHIEEMTLESHPHLQDPQPVEGLRLWRVEEGRFSDFHPAPDRRWMIILEGEVEIGLGDGSLHRFGPGDIRLIEDITGHGHTTRFTQPYLAVLIPAVGPVTGQ